jgi:wobble nucleotide-excising tRNase
MAIKRLISIQNVGRLVKCSQRGPELAKYNLLFAENGRGKSTLCAVLRSLQTGKREYLTERMTKALISAAPKVEIRLGDENAAYDGTKWSATEPNIAIFDSEFVARNVCVGDVVTRDNRTSLLQVIVGEVGVALANEVDQLDERVRNNNAEIAGTRKLIEQRLPRGFQVENFVKLPIDNEVDKKIEATTIERSAVTRSAEIAGRKILSTIEFPRPLANIDELLAGTVEQISQDAAQKLKDHLTHHKMGADGEAWLAKGLSYLVDEECPFCGQSTTGLSIVQAYAKLFSDEYRGLRDRVVELRRAVDALFGGNSIAALQQVVANNLVLAEFWKQFDRLGEAPQVGEELIAAIRGYHSAAAPLLERKIANPLDPIEPSMQLASAAAALLGATDKCQAYNAWVSNVNALISNRKQQTQVGDLEKIAAQLAQLSLIKLRSDDALRANCDKYSDLLKVRDELSAAKEAAKTKLDNHADEMIKRYEVAINKLLKSFGAGFSIGNSRKNYLGGTATSTYQIIINDLPIELGDANTPIGQPSFRTALSSGDRSALALAFFLAQLDHDRDRQEKIVIFDDPFSSQDRFRRERTAELLKKYGNDCEQLFLLSHDPYFLKRVYSKLPRAETRTLQLSRTGERATAIEEWDVEQETREGYFRDHAALHAYLLTGGKALIETVRRIRPVLEGYIRYRFPNRFEDRDWLGDMIAKIREAGDAHPLFGVLEQIEEINEYSKRYHHDTNPGGADTEVLDDQELRSYVHLTLEIVGGY